MGTDSTPAIPTNRRDFEKLQRLYDTAVPGNCPRCGMLVAKHTPIDSVKKLCELDDNSNPTLNEHKCPVVGFAKLLRERLNKKKS